MAAGSPPIYRVTVTARTAKAISYRHRSGATKIDFRGTELLPGARGEAKVESKQGRIEIAVEFDGLEAATKNGTEYLTYVLWAVTPEGRTSNLGEVLLNGTKSKLDVSTELQVFGLVVTAEPYFAVTQPSDLIVMENVVRADTVGKIEEIDAKYELLQRGQYQHLANPLALKADRKLPLELYEARNAVQIARSMGADRFAVETFRKAEKSLAESEAYQQRNAGRKPVTMTAREAVQTAEDSRAIAVKRQEEDALAAERQAAMDREARAENRRLTAQSETDRVTREAEAARVQALAQAEGLKRENDARVAAGVADADRLRRENDARVAAGVADADRLRLENEARATAAKTEADSRIAAAGAEADRLRSDNDSRATAAKAEADRLKADNDSKMAAAGAEADRLRADNDSRATAAKAEADRLKADNDSKMVAAGAEADRLKHENEAQRAATQAELDSAARQTARLEAQKVELRVLLLKQFNAILQTRDTARGLIVNMSDVLFDTGKSSLRPLAREKLAKVAGIVSGHPGLRLDVEGYTDSVGGDAYNQQLSEQRGESVRGYLTQQGMAAGSVSSKGFGKTQPVASNDTAQGRQLNRRVELVISGEVIGTEIGKIVADR
jgi:outer membrane protein OmpA-like peptidoglycan-associated protein